MFAAPIRMILAQPECAEDSNNELRAVVFSQNVTEEQTEQFDRRFGAPLLQLYGMTETIAPPLLNPLFGERRNMSLGRPTLGARLRVVDSSGADVQPGSTGELLVAGEPGHTLMAGYLDDEDATRAVLRDGWLHTGDNVRVDADEFVHFVDRARDMIKRAGENIAAGEIEAVANAHPAIFDAAAVGIPTPCETKPSSSSSLRPLSSARKLFCLGAGSVWRPSRCRVSSPSSTCCPARLWGMSARRCSGVN